MFLALCKVDSLVRNRGALHCMKMVADRCLSSPPSESEISITLSMVPKNRPSSMIIVLVYQAVSSSPWLKNMSSSMC